jgi:hypothetical protein
VAAGIPGHRLTPARLALLGRGNSQERERLGADAARRGVVNPQRLAVCAGDPGNAKRLWEVSLELLDSGHKHAFTQQAHPAASS